jgi:hypothetical protein
MVLPAATDVCYEHVSLSDKAVMLLYSPLDRLKGQMRPISVARFERTPVLSA